MVPKTSNIIYSEKEKLEIIGIDLLKESPYQGRLLSITDPDQDGFAAKNISELSESISRSGLMTPIVVRRSGKGYEIIDGHRRVLVCRNLGMNEVKAIVTHAGDREAQVMGIIGNLQRKNLSSIELAMAYRKILESGYFKDKKELSLALGKDETYVGDLRNTLNMDSRVVKDLTQNNTIRDLKIMRAIRKAAPAPEGQKSDEQWKLYSQVVKENLTRGQLKNVITKKFHYTPKSWKVIETPRMLSLKIPTGKLLSRQKERLKKMITEKLGKNGIVINNPSPHV